MSEKSSPFPILKSWFKRGKQHFQSIPVLIWSNALTILLLSLLSIYAKIKSTGSGIANLFDDPFYLSTFYGGWLTSFSEILWCTAIAICLFASFLVPKSNRSFLAFLWGSSFVMLLLFLDDRFRITLLLCAFFGTCKLVKLIVYSVYGIMLISYSLVFRRTILQTP
ncbi:MAG: hypothetical protein ACRC1Z_23680, partial [Waterburya sp.]